MSRAARRWAMDYDFASSNVLTTWLAPRGTRALFSRLRATGSRYAVTGSFAGHRVAPIAEPRLAALYVDDPATAAQSLRLRPAETGGNVLLVRPFDPVVFERAEHAAGITFARVTQVLLDLMTGPGRGPAAAATSAGVAAGPTADSSGSAGSPLSFQSISTISQAAWEARMISSGLFWNRVDPAVDVRGAVLGIVAHAQTDAQHHGGHLRPQFRLGIGIGAKYALHACLPVQPRTVSNGPAHAGYRRSSRCPR